MLVGCLTSQQHASVSQGRICSDKLTCCHTEIPRAKAGIELRIFLSRQTPLPLGQRGGPSDAAVAVVLVVVILFFVVVLFLFFFCCYYHCFCYCYCCCRQAIIVILSTASSRCLYTVSPCSHMVLRLVTGLSVPVATWYYGWLSACQSL